MIRKTLTIKTIDGNHTEVVIARNEVDFVRKAREIESRPGVIGWGTQSTVTFQGR